MIRFDHKLYPKTELCFMTNGVLIPLQRNEFWEIYADCGVKVYISRYPIKLDILKNKEIEKSGEYILTGFAVMIFLLKKCGST